MAPTEYLKTFQVSEEITNGLLDLGYTLDTMPSTTPLCVTWVVCAPHVVATISVSSSDFFMLPDAVLFSGRKWVTQPYQSQGIGTWLSKVVQEFAKHVATEMKTQVVLIASVDTDNKKQNKTMARIGWKIVVEHEDFYLYSISVDPKLK